MPPRVYESLAPLSDGNEGVRQSLARMRAVIREAPFSSRITALAATFPPGDEGIERAMYWVRGHLHYQDHPPGEQTIVTPAYLVEQMRVSPDGKTIGDCVAYVLLLGALLWPRHALRLVVRSNRSDREYNHVYLRVQGEQGWIAVDPTSDAAMGWEEDQGITAREEVPV